MNKDFIYILNNVINTLFMFCITIITITIENN